jgi:hypothetical protein
LDFGDGSVPATGTVGTWRDVPHRYQMVGTYTVSVSGHDSDGDSASRSIQVDIVLPPTVTGSVNGIPVASNDSNVTVDPNSVPAAATNQSWGVRPNYPGMWSTSFDVPVHLSLDVSGVPDGSDIRFYYAMLFGGCPPSGCGNDPGSISAYACGVGSDLIGTLCTDGSNGPQTVSAQGTFSRIGLPGDVANPSVLELWLQTPTGDTLLTPAAGSGVAVFLPPTCGGSAPLTCPSSATRAGSLPASLATSMPASFSRVKTVTYYWRQLFQASDTFLVKRRGRVVHRTSVSGKPSILHAHKWSCPREGTFSLQVIGRSSNGIVRKMRKRAVHCP